MLTSAEKHSVHSSTREEYVEYIFLAELCSHAWETENFVEVARSHTDAFGYDIILTCNGSVRHVQLKATMTGGKASYQKVNSALSKAPSGCVVWLYVNPQTLEIENIGWFGGKPGEKLPSLGEELARHTKGDKDGVKAIRPGIHKVKKANFVWLNNTTELFVHMFKNEGTQQCQP